MPDPALTQAQFDAVFDRLCEPLCAWRTLREQWRRFAEEKIRLYEVGATIALTDWTFTAVDMSFLDQGGAVYIRVTDENPGAGSALVEGFRATGGGAGDKIFTGSAADGADATLAAANSSGWAGTVTLPNPVSASDATDGHILYMQPDFRQRVRYIFDGAESQDYGREQLAQEWQRVLGRVAANINSARTTVEGYVRYLLTNYIADKLTTDDRATAGYLTSSDKDTSSGTITVSKSGIVRDLELVMGENTTAQAVLNKVPTAGSASAESTNRGKLTIGSITLTPGARAGSITLLCTTGGASNFGAEELTVSLKPSSNGGPRMDDRTITAQKTAKPGSTFRAPEIGLESCTIARDTDKSNDATHTEFANAEIVLSGESSSNTASGVLYAWATGTSPNLTISFYKASGQGASDLVAQVSGISNSGAFTAVAQNSSGLTVTGTAGSTPTEKEVVFDCNGLESDSNGTNKPDRWTIAISDPATSATYGKIQECISEIFGPAAEIAEDSTGNETIEEGVVTRGGENPLLVVAE